MNLTVANDMEGDPRAVLTWYDFLCPFCYVGQHRTAILVRHGLGVVELPFQAHPDIPPRAFPQFHKDLFAAHFVLGEDLEDSAVIDRHASGAGVDLGALHTALADGSTAAGVDEAEATGRKYGVQGTPAWLLARGLITGLLPAEEFESLAEHAIQFR